MGHRCFLADLALSVTARLVLLFVGGTSLSNPLSSSSAPIALITRPASPSRSKGGYRKFRELMTTLSTDPTYRGAVRPGLAVKCQKHGRTNVLVGREGFAQLAPEGGCDEPCVEMLPCGHRRVCENTIAALSCWHRTALLSKEAICWPRAVFFGAAAAFFNPTQRQEAVGTATVGARRAHAGASSSATTAPTQKSSAASSSRGPASSDTPSRPSAETPSCRPAPSAPR